MFQSKKIIPAFLIAILFFFSNQIIAQDVNEPSDSTIQYVTIFKDSRLDILNTRAKLIAEANVVKAKVEKSKDVMPVYNPIKAGSKTVTGSILQKNGFRVLIYNGADRTLAMKIKTEFNRKFPGMRSYMSYNVPNFKIKVGDFEDKKSATKFLKTISPILPTASIVPDVVTVKNILVQ